MFAQDWLLPFRGWSDAIADTLPSIGGAIALVVMGWIIAHLVRFSSRHLFEKGIARLTKPGFLTRALHESEAQSRIPKLVSMFLFWIVFVLFTAAAFETVGLPVVTGSVNRFAYYLPNVLAAGIIMFAGIVAGNIAHDFARSAAERASVTRAPLVGALAQAAVVLVAGIVTLEQLGINGDVVVVIFATVIGGLLATAGLAFGLGARLAVGNLIASQYVARSYQLGQTVSIDGVQGPITGITATSVIIDADQGKVWMPAQRFMEVMATVVHSKPSAHGEAS